MNGRPSSAWVGALAGALTLAGCIEEPPPRQPTARSSFPTATAKRAVDPMPPPAPPLPVQLAELGPGSATFSIAPGPDPKRAMVTQVVAGDPIYARITVPHSLRTSASAVGFHLVADWKLADGVTHSCGTDIEGTSKAGARALVATTFDASLFALPGAPESDVVVKCEEHLRADASSGALGATTLRLRLTASYEGRTTDVVDAQLALDGTDRAAVAQRLARIDVAAANEEKRQIAQRRLPASLSPLLDPAGMIAVREEIQDEKITEFVPLRVAMTERDFTIHRDDKTSVVLRRDIAGMVAFKKPDGTCFLQDVYFTQEFDGVSYGRLTADFPRHPDGPQLLCANIGP